MIYVTIHEYYILSKIVVDSGFQNCFQVTFTNPVRKRFEKLMYLQFCIVKIVNITGTSCQCRIDETIKISFMISCYLWMAINSGVETKPVSWRLVSGNGAEVEGAT